MATPIWPETLPQFVLQSGYSEKKQDQGLRSPMEGGSTKTRRRFTARFDQIDVRFLMTPAQTDAFETFYEDTLKGGTLNFDWIHPRRRTPRRMQIIGSVTITDSDGNNTVSFKLELKP